MQPLHRGRQHTHRRDPCFPVRPHDDIRCSSWTDTLGTPRFVDNRTDPLDLACQCDELDERAKPLAADRARKVPNGEPSRNTNSGRYQHKSFWVRTCQHLADRTGSPLPACDNQQRSWSVSLLMPLLLMTGTIIVAGALAIEFIKMYRWMQYGREYSNPLSSQALAAAQRVFGDGRHIRLRSVHQLASTVTFDWLWPTILVSENFAALSQADQVSLLKHEVARLARGDSGTSVLLAIVRIFHWWNPHFWWADYAWRLERELACDALLMKHLSSEQSAEYLHYLQQTQDSRPHSARVAIEAPGFILNLNTRPILRQRIQALSRTYRPEKPWIYWFSWCVISVLGVAGFTDAAKTPPQKIPIQLPAGTIWFKNDSLESTPEQPETRSYQLT